MEFLNWLNQYAQLINFVFFITIVGWLFSLTRLYSEAQEKKFEALLADKDSDIRRLEREVKQAEDGFQAKLAAKEQTITTLQTRLESETELHQATVATLRERLEGTLERSNALEAARREHWELKEQTYVNRIEYLNFRILMLEELSKLPAEAEPLRVYLESRIKELEQQEKRESGQRKEEIKKEKSFLKSLTERLGQVDPNTLASVARVGVPLGLAYLNTRLSTEEDNDFALDELPTDSEE